MATRRLAGTGIWSGQLRYGDAGEIAEAAAELETIGYSALWIPDVGGDVFGGLRRLLEATKTVTAATGILNLWMHPAADVGRELAALDADFADRTLLGIGVSHAPLIDREEAGRYRQPIRVMREYLAALDAASPPTPRARRVLAALGPQMLELARDRASGAHPYLANPDHTHFARGVLGDEPMLLPEQPVVLERDPARAREAARNHLAVYLSLPNYVNNLRRIGFTADDVSTGGSDRLVDGIVAWGDETAIAARVGAHFDAGADHVCIQVVTLPPNDGLPRAQWRALAAAVVDLRPSPT
jgi:probable F420-dependent oxidoreductase